MLTGTNFQIPLILHTLVRNVHGENNTENYNIGYVVLPPEILKNNGVDSVISININIILWLMKQNNDT